MSPILFFIIFFTCTGVGKIFFTNKFSSSGIYGYFNSSVRRVKHLPVAYIRSVGWKIKSYHNLHISNGGVIFMAIKIIGGMVH